MSGVFWHLDDRFQYGFWVKLSSICVNLKRKVTRFLKKITFIEWYIFLTSVTSVLRFHFDIALKIYHIFIIYLFFG
jgi:hypothetical protein